MKATFPFVRQFHRQFSSLSTIVICLTGTAAHAADAVFSSAILGAGNFDSSVGLSSSKTYLNAVNLQGGGLTINGVNFEASWGGNPSGTNYSVSGVGNDHAGGTNNVTGQLGSLLDGFIYNGNPGGLTLTGLTTGQTYSLAFYNRSWSGPGGRTQNMTSSSGASTSFQQDPSSPGDGNLLRYTFTASGTSETVNFAPQGGDGSMHLYGFSTEQVFNNTWTSGADWTTASWSVAAPNAVGANAHFTAQLSPTTLNLDAAQTVGHVRFDGANAWTLSGANTLTLQADIGGVSVLSTTSGSHTISTSVALNSDVLKSGAGTLTLGGALSGSQGVTVGGGTLRFGQSNSYSGATTVNAGTTIDVNDSVQTLTALNGAGTVLNDGSTAKTLTVNSGAFSGNITDHSTGTGTLALTKTGAGTLTLSGANTYTGATTVTQGILSLTANNSIKFSTSLNVSAGAQVDSYLNSQLPTSGWTIAGTVNKAVAWGQDITGAVTLNGGTLSGSDTGAAALSWGQFHLAGATITTTGTSTINASHLGFAGATFSPTGPSDTLTISSIIGTTESKAGALTKTGEGTLNLSGENTYTGATTVTEGALSLTADNSIKFSSALNVAAGAQVDSYGNSQLPTSGWTIAGTVNKAVAWGQDINGAVTLNGGTLSGSGDGEAALSYGQFTLIGATFTTTGASTINASHLGFVGNVTFSPTDSGDTLTISGIIGTAGGDGLAKSGALVKTGLGTVILSGVNTYTGDTTVNEGTLAVNGTSIANTNKLVINGGNVNLTGAETV